MRETALITGGAKRIGKEIALLLSVLGYDIALHYHASKQDAQKTAARINGNNSACEIFRADLENRKDVLSLMHRVRRVLPNVSLLVNCASVFEPGVFLKSPFRHFDRHFDINFKAPLLLSVEFAKEFKKGHIINFLDTNIVHHKTAYSAYLLSKKALAEFTKLAAVEFAPHIRVNAVAPGLILPPEGKSAAYLKKRAARIPLKKPGRLSDIALAVQFLVESGYITGQTIFVDGGEHLI